MILKFYRALLVTAIQGKVENYRFTERLFRLIGFRITVRDGTGLHSMIQSEL